MDTNLLDAKFARIGARLKVADRSSGIVSLDVQTDRKGEFFEIARPPGAEVVVLDVQPAADHATITLHGWHQVVMNTEGQSKAMKNVAFLD